jgi:valyl-tRNA synthetase
VRMPVEKDPATGKNTSPKFDLGRNFCNKLWNASRFAITILENPANSALGTRHSALSLPDRWMLSRLLAATKQINASIEAYQFSDYATALYDLLWRDFCDWYLEAIKPTVGSDPRQRAVLAHTLEAIIRLLHPIAPFITEAIFERLREIETDPIDGITLGPSRIEGLLATAAWPVLESRFEDAEAEERFERVRSLVTAIREVRAQHNVPPKRRITLHIPAQTLRQLGEGADLIRTLSGLELITADQPQGAAVTFTVDGTQATLSNLADAVDAGAEIARLRKLIADKQGAIDTFEKRLANPGYADKAPAHMVQQTRDQLAKAQQERDAAAGQLQALGERP